MSAYKGSLVRGKSIVFNLFLALILLMQAGEVLSQNSLAVDDVTLSKGKLSEISLNGTLSNINAASVEIVISFNMLNLYVGTVKAGAGFALNCEAPPYTIDTNDFVDARIRIKCSDINEVNDGVVCVLVVEALSGPDSVTLLKPESLIINDIPDGSVILTEGRISLPGDIVAQKYPEGIGNNYPNPFYSETSFPLSIFQPTNVKFLVYTTDGRFILSNNESTDMLKLSFYKNNIEVPISDLNGLLQQGNYILRLSPDHMQFASGEYYLIMITDNGVYNKNFMYLK